MPGVIGEGLLKVGGSLLGSLIDSGSADNAADDQRDAAREATDWQRQVFDTTNKQNAPYRQLGYGALNQLATLLGVQPVVGEGETSMLSTNGGRDFGSLMRPFTPGDLSNDPGYQFRLAEGTKA